MQRSTLLSSAMPGMAKQIPHVVCVVSDEMAILLLSISQAWHLRPFVTFLAFATVTLWMFLLPWCNQGYRAQKQLGFATAWAGWSNHTCNNTGLQSYRSTPVTYIACLLWSMHNSMARCLPSATYCTRSIMCRLSDTEISDPSTTKGSLADHLSQARMNCCEGFARESVSCIDIKTCE
jgi:hypothetical protein